MLYHDVFLKYIIYKSGDGDSLEKETTEEPNLKEIYPLIVSTEVILTKSQQKFLTEVQLYYQYKQNPDGVQWQSFEKWKRCQKKNFDTMPKWCQQLLFLIDPAYFKSNYEM